jgi:hypothetical protein
LRLRAFEAEGGCAFLTKVAVSGAAAMGWMGKGGMRQFLQSTLNRLIVITFRVFLGINPFRFPGSFTRWP